MYGRVITNCIPKSSFFLFGPRQTGKTTILESLKPVLNINLLDPGIHLEFSKNPELLKKKIEGLDVKSGLVLIDEVQRVPLLLDVVQMMTGSLPDLHFALSGSSARKLRRGAANLLGGRAVVRSLHPLTMSELGGNFDIDRVLRFGSLPKIYSTAEHGDEDLAGDLLKSYVVTYLQEEIKSESLVRNLQGFQNFLEVAALQFGEQVNFSNIERDTLVSYSAVRDYYSILEDTMIGFFLPPFLRSRRKRMSHAPKFYFFDNGVTRAILGMHRSGVSPLERGRLWEQWFVQEVCRTNDYHRKEWKISFWRTSHGAEVDLVIERGREVLCAIEIKSGKTVSSGDLGGIASFRELYPHVKSYVVHGAGETLNLGGSTLLSAGAMLKKLVDEF